MSRLRQTNGPAGSYHGLIHTTILLCYGRLAVTVYGPDQCRWRRTIGRWCTWSTTTLPCAARWRACSTRWDLTPEPTERLATFSTPALRISRDALLSTS